MKSLKTLVRMHRLKLEEKQRQLNDLEAVAAGFRNQIQSLESTVRDESRTMNHAPDVAHTIGGFVQASLHRRTTLEKSLADVERQVAEVRAVVAEAFRRIKRYETIMERRAEQERLVAGRRARKAENELAIGLFRRNRAAIAE